MTMDWIEDTNNYNGRKRQSIDISPWQHKHNRKQDLSLTSVKRQSLIIGNENTVFVPRN